MAALVVALADLFLPSPARSASSPACDWPGYGHDAGHSFKQSPSCTTLRAGNAALMTPKWLFHARESVSASAAVVDGVVYQGSWDGVLHALDAESGKELWAFRVDDTHEIAFGRIVSSAAVETIRTADGRSVRAVLFGGGGTLYALAPGRTGPRVLAKVDVDPRTPGLRAEHDKAGVRPEVEIESSPVVAHFDDGDRIYVGFDVHNDDSIGRAGLLAFTMRPTGGRVPYAFDLAFKFDPERQAVLHSLTEGSGTGWGCGDVWSSPAFQPTSSHSGVVVFGTGNCDHPTESARAGEVGREGIFAIDAKTGALRWRFHPRGVQDVDDDFGASPNILDNGRAVGEGGKDGWYYKLDLATGKLLWATHAGQAGHLNDGFAVGGFIGTTATGWVNPVGPRPPRRAIFGAVAIPTPIGRTLDDPAGPSLGPGLARDPGRVLSLVALDDETGAVLWRAPLVAPSYGAVTYAHGVVLMADTVTFTLYAFSANTGAPLAARPLPGPPSSAPVVVGDSIYVGLGTSESDLEFKAFDHRLQDLFANTVGQSPLSPLSGVVAFQLPTP